LNSSVSGEATITAEDESESVSKVPLLGDLPLVGPLFRRTERRGEKTTLYIFITPHILYDESFGDQSALTRRRAAAIEALRKRPLDLLLDPRGEPQPVSTFRYGPTPGPAGR